MEEPIFNLTTVHGETCRGYLNEATGDFVRIAESTFEWEEISSLTQDEETAAANSAVEVTQAS